MATSRPSSASLPDAGREEPLIRIRQPLAALLAAAPVAAAPLPAQGPLEVRTPGSLRDLFLDVVPWDARAVNAPRLQVGWVVANDWSTPTTLARNGAAVQVRLDEQADSISAAIRLPWGVVLGSAPGGFARRLASALELRGTWRWGGWSDAVADAWHRVLPFNDFARPAFPRNQVHLLLQGPTAPVDVQSATFARAPAPAALLPCQRGAVAGGAGRRLVVRPRGSLVQRRLPAGLGLRGGESGVERAVERLRGGGDASEPDHRWRALGAGHPLAHGGLLPGRLPGHRGWFYDTNAPDVALGLTLTVD